MQFRKDGWGLLDIPLRRLVFPRIALVDISFACNVSTHVFSVNDILQWEDRHGPLPADSLVLIHTGWGKVRMLLCEMRLCDITTHFILRTANEPVVFRGK